MRLNQNQGYQFYESDTFGTETWGSHNPSAEMPRAYYGGDISWGGYYNKYASSAESAHWEDANYIQTSESICPAGWTLPTSGSGNWGTMFNKEFGYTTDNNPEDALAARKYPISLARAGRIINDSGIQQGIGTSSIYSTKQSGRAVNINLVNDIFLPHAYVYAEIGMPVRCIQKTE